MTGPIVPELGLCFDRGMKVLPILICGLGVCLPLLHVIHCCPFLPVTCCTSVMRELSVRMEMGVYKKRAVLPMI